MKYLQFECLEMMNNCLNNLNQNDNCQVQGRLEAFSCKDTVEDKKLRRLIEAKFISRIDGNSPPIDNSNYHRSSSDELNCNNTPINCNNNTHNLDRRCHEAERVTMKYFFYLLATLNAVFPDYDYSYLSPGAFTPLFSSDAANKLIDSAILFHRSASCSTDLISEMVWNCIDEVVDINGCDIYKFNPDTDDEPDTDNSNVLWSYYLFFFNKKLKRIVFFMTRALCHLSKINYLTQDTDDGCC